jgi:ABC-type uncharacterized transport system permease subunit
MGAWYNGDTTGEGLALSGVSIICFAGSYAVALALELTRLLFRSGVRGAIMLGFGVAGVLAHTLYLFYRIVESYQSAGALDAPLSSQREWYLVAAWLLAIVYLYLTCYHAKVPFGLFLLPLVLGLIGVGALVADPRPLAREPASAAWGLVHGSSLLLATVAVLVAFVAGLMYLGQDHRLKTKSATSSGLRFPSLERLQEINSRSLVIALIMMGVGILSGVALNLTRPPGQQALPWNDPVVVATVSLFAWLVLSSLVGVAYRPARRGRKVVYFTLVSFVFLVIALWSVLGNVTQHLGRGTWRSGASAGQPSGLAHRSCIS